MATISGHAEPDYGQAPTPDRNDAPHVIVVVLVAKANRTQRVAQIYRLASPGAPSLAWDAAMAAETTPPLSQDILARLVRALEAPVTSTWQDEELHPTQEPRAKFPALTPREQEVLQLVLDGLQNKNIANELRISMRTVENHRASIMRKTGSKSLPALVKLAIAAGAVGASRAPDPSRADVGPLIRQTRDRRDFVSV
ncbi:MAG TPA: LuxR C-terminal-related transcriptional regulator [Roseiarcus sp.]